MDTITNIHSEESLARKNDMKVCSNKNCIKKNELQSLENFYPDKRTKDKKQFRCRHCERAYKNGVWNKLTRQEKTNLNLRRYKITTEDYNKILLAQGGRCKICNTDKAGGQWKNNTFFIDHDHNTGKVRGLLCCHCNIGLGKFKDDLKLLESASSYLKSFLETQSE